MPPSPRTSPAPDSSAVSADNRRAYVRFPCELDGSFSPLTGGRGAEWMGKIRDISQGGIGIVLGRRFELGTLLSVEIRDASGLSSGNLLARVVHVTPHTSGGWVIGCCFTNEIGEDDVKRFADG